MNFNVKPSNSPGFYLKKKSDLAKPQLQSLQKLFIGTKDIDLSDNMTKMKGNR